MSTIDHEILSIDCATLAANLKYAASNGGATIGGGEFNSTELLQAARVLEAYPRLVSKLADVELALRSSGLKRPAFWQQSIARTLSEV